MKSVSTRRILDVIKTAISQSIEERNVDLVCQQGHALIIAMKDHIEALEEDLTEEKYEEAA